MNYGGRDYVKPNWSIWKELFLWKPKKINDRWYWLRKVYYRKRLLSKVDNQFNFEYQWAVDLLELMVYDFEKSKLD